MVVGAAVSGGVVGSGAVVTLEAALVVRVAAVREDLELEKGLVIRSTTAATPARNPTPTTHRARRRSPSKAAATSRYVALRAGSAGPWPGRKAVNSASRTVLVK